MNGLAYNKERDETIVFLIEMGNPVVEVAKKFNLSPSGTYGVYYRRKGERIHPERVSLVDEDNHASSNRDFIIEHIDKFEPFDEDDPEWSNFGMIVIE